MFSEGHINVERLALNMEQVRQYNPPPNPAKETDSRFAAYVDEYGDECWELDALSPQALINLIQEAVESIRDDDLWQASVDEQEKQRGKLARLAERVKKGKVRLT